MGRVVLSVVLGRVAIVRFLALRIDAICGQLYPAIDRFELDRVALGCGTGAVFRFRNI